MSLKQRIQEDVKQAMRSRDRDRLAVLRLITAAIKQKEVDERTELDDQGVLAVLDKMAKQRRESIEQYDKAGRVDLAEREREELEIIQSYLPEPLTEDEITALIRDAIDATDAQGMQDMGKVMGHLRDDLQGRADMKAVSQTVRKLLSS